MANYVAVLWANDDSVDAQVEHLDADNPEDAREAIIEKFPNHAILDLFDAQEVSADPELINQASDALEDLRVVQQASKLIVDALHKRGTELPLDVLINMLETVDGLDPLIACGGFKEAEGALMGIVQTLREHGILERL